MIWTTPSRPIYRYALITLALVAPFALTTPVHAQSADTLPVLMTLEAYGFSAVYSPDGSRIVTGSGNDAKVRDASNGKLLQTLEGHKDSIFSAAYSPDGSRIVTASFDNTAKVWDASSGKLLQTLEGHTGSVHSAAYSPDGSRIVTAGWDGTAKVWDASSGRLLITLEGHTSLVNSATYSPDGLRIVTSSSDGTAKVWDASSGKLLKTLQGHKDYVNSAAYSPDGSRIVTASKDQTAKVWDASSGRLLQTLAGHTDQVRSAVYSPDGSKIITASDDGTTKVWDASSLAGSSARTLPVTKPKVSGANMTQTSTDGPFGLRMGMSLEEIIKIDPSFKKSAISNVYSMNNPPVSNSLFESYVLTITPKAGLCAITAIGANVNSNDFGDQVKKAFGNIESVLNSKYSQGTKLDYLKSGSMWKDDNYWMMSLYKQDRTLDTTWFQSEIPAMSPSISYIKLSASALDTSTGYVSVKYVLSNFDSCSLELENSKEKGL